MDADQMVEKKLGLSLDELIAQQRVKQGKTKPAGGSAKKKTLVSGRAAPWASGTAAHNVAAAAGGAPSPRRVSKGHRSLRRRHSVHSSAFC